MTHRFPGGPYRESQIPPLGPRPHCDHLLGPENRQALAAVGGWWHNDDCLSWHRALWERDPRDPRMCEFLATCTKSLRAQYPR